MAYYFLASLLPPLEIGHVPSLGFAELKALFDANLTAVDRTKVRAFLSLIDIENMRAFWAHEPFDTRGNVPLSQMEQCFLDFTWPSGDVFPFFLIDFLLKYRTDEDRLTHFSLLLSQFFNDRIERETGFVREYFAFQREMRLIIMGFRAKKLHKDLAEELKYEEGTDPIVAQILAQKDAKSYEPPFEYKELKPIFSEFENAPLDLYRELFEYQFNHIIELWGGELFSLDRLLNYTARLILVERWQELDVQKGIKVVDHIEREVT